MRWLGGVNCLTPLAPRHTLAAMPKALPLPRRPRATLYPRFTLSLLYLFGFFLLYCLILVAPALFEVAATVPPGPEQQRVAEQVAKEAVQPKLWLAMVAAVATTGLGIYARALPGLRGRP